MENENQNLSEADRIHSKAQPAAEQELLKSQGRTYTQKSKKLEDAKSSSVLFIIFGIVGLILLLALWLGFLPLQLAFYMKVLYTVVLGGLFLLFIVIGIYYTRKIKDLKSESSSEEHQSHEIIQWMTSSYSLAELDKMVDAGSVPMEQLYFERYEKMAALIREKYQIQDENYLDYLIEKIYQIYSPEE